MNYNKFVERFSKALQNERSKEFTMEVSRKCSKNFAKELLKIPIKLLKKLSSSL